MGRAGHLRPVARETLVQQSLWLKKPPRSSPRPGGNPCAPVIVLSGFPVSWPPNLFMGHSGRFPGEAPTVLGPFSTDPIVGPAWPSSGAGTLNGQPHMLTSWLTEPARRSVRTLRCHLGSAGAPSAMNAVRGWVMAVLTSHLPLPFPPPQVHFLL